MLNQFNNIFSSPLSSQEDVKYQKKDSHVPENLVEEKKSVELLGKNLQQDLNKSTPISKSSSFELSSPLLNKQHLQPNQESTTQSTLTPLQEVTPNLKREAAEVYLQQAIAYSDKQKWSEVIEACQHAVEIIPDIAEAYKLWGNALQRMGQTEEAMGLYAKALEIKPDLAEVYANLGSLYAQQKKWQKAREYYQKAIVIKPDFSGAYRNLARVWKQLGEPEKAAQCQNQALSLESQEVNVEEYVRSGDLLMGENKPEQALEYYLKAVKLSPDLQIGHQKVAETWGKLGKWQEAAKCWERALSIEPQSANAQKYFQLGDVFLKQNQLEEAISVYKKALQLNPNFVPALVRLTRIYDSQKQFNQAVTYCQRVVQLLPNNKEAQNKLTSLVRKQEKKIEEPATVKAHLNAGNKLSKEGKVSQELNETGATSISNNLVIVLGHGNSGNRLISYTLYASGIYMGESLNSTGDKIPPTPIYQACRIMAEYVKWNGELSWDFSGLFTADIPDEFKQLVNEYLTDLLKFPPKRIKGWKLPETTLIYPWIVRMFPEAKYIHWVRDPRDCIISEHLTDRMEQFGIQYPKTESIREKRAISWYYQYHLIKATPSPKNSILVRYEDFVRKQEETLVRLEEFLEVPLARVVVHKDTIGRWKTDKDKHFFPFLQSALTENG